MNKHKLAVLIIGAVLVTSICTLGFTSAKGTPLQTGDIVYYLSNDRIYSFTTPNNNKVALVYAPPVEGKGEKYQINGLSCGPKDTLLFHLTHTTDLVPDFSKTRNKTTAVIYDPQLKSLSTIVDLGESAAEFPVLSPDESKLAVCTSDSKHNGFYFTVRDMKTGELTQYDRLSACNKLVSFGSRGEEFAFQGTDNKTGKPRIYFFNMKKNEVMSSKEGMMPRISPSGQLIAYTSPDQRQLIISDGEGKAIQRFSGYLFKDLNGWISEKKVIFTIGHFMYINHIGIADLEKKKIYRLKVPTTGEINGICYRSKSEMRH